VDFGHIYEAHCNERRCRNSFLNLDFGGKEKYYRYLKGIQKGDIPVKRKKAGEGLKGIRQAMEFFDGKLYRLMDGVCLGSVIGKEDENVLVSKDSNNTPAQYRLISIKRVKELIKYLEALEEKTSNLCC
jgi:hypothetical protein